MYIEDHTISMLDFVDWLSLKQGEKSFCSFAFLLLGVFYILRVSCATPPLRHF